MQVDDAIKLGFEAFELVRGMLTSARKAGQVSVLEAIASDLGSVADVYAAKVGSQAFDPTLASHQCSDRCSYCCHLTVGCTVPELYLLWSAIPEKLRKGVGQLARDRKRMGEKERCRQKMPCMFLDTVISLEPGQPAKVGNSWEANCTVYKSRPLACRAMYAVRRDMCQQGFGKPDAHIAYPNLPRLPIQAMEAGAMAALSELGCEPYVVDMDRALAVLAADPDPQGVFKGWMLGHCTVLTKARLKGAPKPEQLERLVDNLRMSCSSGK